MSDAAAAGSGPELAAGPSSAGSHEGHSGGAASPAAAAAGPTAWLRRLLRGAQAVAEERPAGALAGLGAACDEDEEQDDVASEDGGAAWPPRDSFGGLPEHLLEKVFSHLRGANRRHHFAMCGVNRQWRRLGRQMYFSRPWEVAHLICHPTQLFCLSPRNVTGSRSGLLKCFVRRENGPGGKRFTFHIGKDSTQPQRSRFLMAAKQGGRDEVHIFLNSRCQGPPCARLRCNMFATQYKLTLADDLHLEPTSSSTAGAAGGAAQAAAAAASSSSALPDFNRLNSWGDEAAAQAIAAAAAQRRQQQRLHQDQDQEDGQQEEEEGLGLDCFAELQYQARVKGFMQPRRMRVSLPHPSQLFYDQQLPQLHRRNSETSACLQVASLDLSGGGGGGNNAAGTSARRTVSQGAASSASSSMAASPETSPAGAAGLGAAAGAGEPGAAAGGEEQQQLMLQPAGSGRVGRLLLRMRRRQQQLPKLLRQPKTVPVDEALQPVVLHNKAPHWNEGLRCWCLNFRGRVKLASVKNFQLVRADDAAERVVMQFGKAEQDAFILDFNPTVLTAFQAFAVVLSTFDSKFLL